MTTRKQPILKIKQVPCKRDCGRMVLSVQRPYHVKVEFADICNECLTDEEKKKRFGHFSPYSKNKISGED